MFPRICSVDTQRGGVGRQPARGMLRAILRVIGLLSVILAVIAFAAVVAFVAWADWREIEPPTLAAPAGGRYVETPGARVFLQEWGRPNAPMVIFVPGAPAWGGFWADTARSVARAGFRTVAIDLPPFGFAEHDPASRYGRIDQAARIAAVIDALAVCRAVLVGHSLGAAPVAEALLRYPERVSGAVFIDALLGWPPEGRMARGLPLGLGTALEWVAVRRSIAALTITNPMITRRALDRTLARHEAATFDRVATLQRPLNRIGSTTAYGAWLASLVRTEGGALSADPVTFEAVTVPSAVLWGEADPIAPLAEGRRLARALSGASLDTFAGVGHMPHIEAPDSTEQVLVSRVRELLARRVRQPDARDPRSPRRSGCA